MKVADSWNHRVAEWRAKQPGQLAILDAWVAKQKQRPATHPEAIRQLLSQILES